MFNITFVFSKYLSFLKKQDLLLNIKFKMTEIKFNIEITCEGMKGETVEEILEGNETLAKEVHILKTRLHYLEYLAKQNGGDLRYVPKNMNAIYTVIYGFPIQDLLGSSGKTSAIQSLFLKQLENSS